MKNLFVLLLTIATLTHSGAFAAEVSEADQKWVATVQKLVATGTTKLTTQSRARVELIKTLEKKLGKKVRAEKTESGFVLFFESADLKTASVK